MPGGTDEGWIGSIDVLSGWKKRPRDFWDNVPIIVP